MQCERKMPAAHLVAAYRGLYDYEEMQFLRAYLRPGDSMLDVGANVGVYALMAGPLVGETGHLDCFEPTPRTRRRLLANLLLSDLSQVRVWPYACSDVEGRLQFVATDDDHTNQLASEERLAAQREQSAATQPIEVETRRLDSLVAGVPYAVGKLDIEGAEPLALAGAEGLLAAAAPPVWILELSWRVEQFGWTTERFAAWLHDRGFDLLRYDVATAALAEADLTARHCNVLAVARTRRDEVEARLAGRD